jgi:hypothetical protein
MTVLTLQRKGLSGSYSKFSRSIELAPSLDGITITGSPINVFEALERSMAGNRRIEVAALALGGLSLGLIVRGAWQPHRYEG